MDFLRSKSPKYNWLHEKGGASPEDARSVEGYDSDTVAGSEGYERQSKRRNTSLTLSLVLNASLLLLVVLLLWRDVRGHSRNPKLLPTPVPEFSNEVRTFKLDPLFLSLPTPESNDAWEALPGPNGRGFINIDPKLGLDLPDKKAGLSVFHQLHCLGALRNFTWELMYDRVDREALLKTWPTNVTSPTYDQAINGMWHYAHCFDYLRQGIQCSGDTSLEFVHGGTGKSVVDGLDYPHVCRNWDDLWTYAKLNG